MSEALPIKMAESNLEELLKDLSLGESITLIGQEGSPVALLISLKSGKIQKNRAYDWDTRMDTMAEKVNRAWKRNAVEVLSEMRR